MEHHAATATKEARKPLDWTKPAPAPKTPAATTSPREDLAKPTTHAAEGEGPTAPKPKEAPAAPKATEPETPRITEEPSAPARPQEPERTPTRPTEEPAAKPAAEGEPPSKTGPLEEAQRPAAADEHPAVGRTKRVTIGGEEHNLSIRRIGRRLLMILCSNQCGEIIFKIRRMQSQVKPGTPEFEALESLAQRARAADEKINGVTPKSDADAITAADTELNGLRKAMQDIHEAYPKLVDPDVPVIPEGGGVKPEPGTSGRRVDLKAHMESTANPVQNQESIPLKKGSVAPLEKLMELRRAAAARGENVEFIYAVRDEITGEVLKVGETADIVTRGKVYERAGRLHAMGRKLVLEVQPIEVKEGTAKVVEAGVRKSVVRGIMSERGDQRALPGTEVLPWDNEFAGRSGQGTPGVSDPEMRQPVSPGSKERTEYWWREKIWSRKTGGPAPPSNRTPEWQQNTDKLGDLLLKHDGNVTAAAKELGQPRTTVQSFMERERLTPEGLMSAAKARSTTP
jgi:hypothetical protein